MKASFGTTLKRPEKNDGRCMAWTALAAEKRNRSGRQRFFYRNSAARFVDIVIFDHGLTYNAALTGAADSTTGNGAA